jgi:hypothetical protein
MQTNGVEEDDGMLRDVVIDPTVQDVSIDSWKESRLLVDATVIVLQVGIMSLHANTGTFRLPRGATET